MQTLREGLDATIEDGSELQAAKVTMDFGFMCLAKLDLFARQLAFRGRSLGTIGFGHREILFRLVLAIILAGKMIVTVESTRVAAYLARLVGSV